MKLCLKKPRKRVLRNPLFFYTSNCKFCYEYTHPQDKLYCVCKCKGTMEWCHISCLRECIKYKYKNKFICDICLSPYIIPDPE